MIVRPDFYPRDMARIERNGRCRAIGLSAREVVCEGERTGHKPPREPVEHRVLVKCRLGDSY
eukprot:4916867-Pleurochrysis_carterae.AAC.1